VKEEGHQRSSPGGSLVAGRGKITLSETNLQDRLYGGVHSGAEGGESSRVGVEL
jgi:hypothetical protein